MKRVIKSGSTYEVSVFLVGDNARPRGKRCGEYTPRKQDANDRLAVRRMSRMLNGNFSPRDMLLTVEHLDDVTLEQARADARRYIDRLCYHAKKLGIVPKWYFVTSDIDPRTKERASHRTGELIRPHTHIVITRLPPELVHKQWTHGDVNVRFLRDQGDYTAVATYIIRQTRRDLGVKGYSASRNMTKPTIISEEIISSPSKPVGVPVGAVVQERAAFDVANPYQYVRYVYKPSPRRRRRE